MGYGGKTRSVGGRRQNRCAHQDPLGNEAIPAWDIVNVYVGYSYRFASIQLSTQNVFDNPYRVYASGVDGYGRCITALVNLRF